MNKCFINIYRYLFIPFVKSHHTFKVIVHYVPPQHAYCDCYTDFLCIFPSLSILQEKKKKEETKEHHHSEDYTTAPEDLSVDILKLHGNILQWECFRDMGWWHFWMGSE